MQPAKTTPIAIRVEGISKQYRKGALNPSRSLRDFLETVIRLKFASREPAEFGTDGYFWALKDVHFSVRQGEVVGIVGHNGAGKSVLLKILSRVVKPTAGYAETRGRVGSMLEAGVGFHPELTGRENIYLTGSVLRMPWSEVSRNFDEIAAFSGVESFLDTPVKRYSNGMKARLAFAIAFFLEPEILIIDEVLTVEDAEFAARCHAKIKEMAGHGTTILLVSHNQAAISALCSRALLLEHGRIICDDTPDEVLRRYNRRLPQAKTRDRE